MEASLPAQGLMNGSRTRYRTMHSLFPGLLEELQRTLSRNGAGDVTVTRGNDRFWAIPCGAGQLLIEHVDRSAETAYGAEITSLRTQFEQVEKMASLGELVAQISHEMNTPLGVCVTSASHLSDRIDDLARGFTDGTLSRSGMEKFVHDAQLVARLVNTNLKRATSIIKSLRNLARDIRRQDREKLPLAAYVAETVAQLSPIAEKHAVTVRVSIPPEIVVYQSPSALSQVLSNLLVNSFRHGFANRTDSGPAVVEITAEDAGELVRLTYRDNGRGVPPDLADRIFEPFVSGSSHPGSTGLGLSIVRDLVETQLGGHIALLPTTRGAGFAVTLRRNA